MFQNKITKVKKRDGEIVEFDQARIEEAIFKALTASSQGDGKRAKKVSKRVAQILNRRFTDEFNNFNGRSRNNQLLNIGRILFIKSGVGCRDG